MPSSPTPKSLRRLLDLLSALPVSAQATVAELRQALGERGNAVEPRTVQRDLRLLQRHFEIECDEGSKPHGWRWRSMAARQAVAGMSTPEALSLVLVARHLRAALPASWSPRLQELFAQAQQVLDRQGPRAGARRWADKLQVVPPGLALKPPALPTEDLLAEVAEALMQDRQLDLRYRKGSASQAAHYRLHPLGLLLRGHALYLVALSDSARHEVPRLFALHRVQAASMRPEPVAIPEGLSLAQAMADGRGQFGAMASNQALDLKLACSASLAAVLDEAPLDESQQLTPMADGRVLLQVRLKPSWELRWWLLGHIDEIELLAPTELRDEIRQTLETALQRHGKSG
ncbi:WYL domain-containing protein [Pelomonas sp. SE-A7]|uniref:helix-turn-helix transcriptional regulator n=1 Tax=Pelomonas sp. SE-A7 TaxID=3054953 RepID=UPI00259C6B4B|nr:WYL domain-containing protein [Pelomonas sp. SE-A7]MDM4765244.1 WYL domain-containing protein [Pelomonas sp. SE-A7]